MKKGFTLIELLIVIAIIGILAVALLPSILSAPASARNAAKQAAMSQIAVALEQYNASNGKYPDLAAASTGECMTPTSSAAAGTAKGALTPFFKNSALPVIDVPIGTDSAAPVPSSCLGFYYCKYSSNRYFLAVGMEPPAATGKGRNAGTQATACDGSVAAPTTWGITTATNTYSILN